MDMSVPAHVQLDPHWPDWAVGGDEYEDFLASWEFHYKHTTSESSNAYMRDYRDLPYTKASSYTPEDKDYNDDLTNLFYSLATFADWYDSDNEDGESATRYNMAHNAFDYTKNVTAVWYTTFGIEQYDALADGHCFVVNCNWSHDASIIYTNQLLINSISGLGAGVTVHYTSGETEYFGEVEDESNVPWAVCGQILQPELETRAIGYVAALYQLFWDETHPRTFTHIIVDGDYEVDENSGAQYTCTAHYDDGTDSDVTSSASWSDNSSYASISSSGYLTTSAVPADQPCRITASYLGDSDTHDITIKNITTTPTAGTPSSIAVPLSDSDGSYTVSWGASSTSSVTYVLEEATNPSFTSDLRPAYSGSSLSMMITGRSSGTTYYYRVKATRSGYADSDWKECTNGCTVGITSDESLIAYYPFNGNANDESGNGNHGTVYGATLTTDRLGNTDSAYEFDGQASYIEVPDSSSLDITGPITISAYIKADFDQYFRVGLVTKKSEYHPCPGYQLFLSDMNDNGVNYARFGLVYIDPEAPNGDAEIYVGSNTALNDNQWHHIATTYDGSNVKMYIEGRLEDVTLFDGLCGENDEPLFIGLYPYAYSDGHGNLPNILKGCIDEVRIYNRALSTSEIRQLSGTGYKDSLQSIFLLLLDN